MCIRIGYILQGGKGPPCILFGLTQSGYAARMVNRLKKLRKRRGLSQRELGELAGTSRGQIAKLERGERRLTVDWMQRLAGPLHCSPSELMDATVTSLKPAQVVGAVCAGDYKEAIEWPVDDQYNVGYYEDGIFPGIKRFALRVDGPSMNKILPDGSHIICVKLIDAAYQPKTGDLVIVHRLNKHGFTEATVKEYSIDDTGQHWLWPRSDHPEHQSPIEVRQPGNGDEIEGIYLSAVVLQKICPTFRK